MNNVVKGQGWRKVEEKKEQKSDPVMNMITVNNSDVSFPYSYHPGGKWVTFRTLYGVYSF